MFKVLTVLSILSTTTLLGSGNTDFDIAAQLAKEPAKSCLKKNLETNQEKNQATQKKSLQWNVQEKVAPENLSALALGEEDESPLFLGQFSTQEQYDAHVEIDPETGEKKKVVIFQFEAHETTGAYIMKKILICPLQEVENRIKARERTNHWETLADMEWQYSFHALETIFGLTDEKFERNPLWEKDTHYEATMVIQALSSFWGIPTNYNADFLTNERSAIMKKAIKDYSKSPYTRTEVKVETVDLWGGRKISARDKKAYKEAKELIRTQKIDSYQQSIQNAAKNAEEHLKTLITTGIFETVKEKIITDLQSDLLSGQPFSDVLDSQDPALRSHLQRFAIGIKQFFYFPLSHEEEEFLKTYKLPTENIKTEETSPQEA